MVGTGEESRGEMGGDLVEWSGQERCGEWAREGDVAECVFYAEFLSLMGCPRVWCEID